MAEFTIRGVIANMEARLTWRDGELEGPRWLTGLMRVAARAAEGIPIGYPTAAETTRRHLEAPLSVLRLAETEIFDQILSIEGDVPTLPAPDDPNEIN